ncbi:MAG: isocitrate lyase/phosphoenolpyruvate mutase family protein [Propionivibrio sp.]|uniref:isocitrate lyase/PEP mutase family protein n=1 Tax=Propionivibrio sp. TaxID=2212460 RepID=UPI001A3A2E38|nr:isocitrate lyase/phosphoenolpyruvate mutase family protein [Propionivibrio sp.]MBL8414704.1 isocitrate lyase/phosphoenolpyruvate mutase family protein [Propionivibrio sp.]
MKSQNEKSAEFVNLHRKGHCFVIPNPWDAGSARLLEHLGFKALATTGAGFAFSQGKSDLSINAKEMLPHLTQLCNVTSLPISADLQNGFGSTPEDAAMTITEAAKTGIVGCSIEDASGELEHPIYDLGLARERIQHAVSAAKSLDFKFILTARAENYFYGNPDLEDTILRLQAYQDAGADVLYAPGVQSRADIKSILNSIDRPLNVLMGLRGEQLTLAELSELGVARISLGGSLARTAYSAMISAIREITSTGSFDYASNAITGKEINAIFDRPTPLR